MKRTLLSAARFFVLSIFVLCFCNSKLLASHVYGADLFYTHLTGNNYRISLVVYGDCNLNNPTFGTLSTSSPEIDIFNGSSFVTTLNLAIQSPSAGTEVTPVCASQLNSTTCVSTSGTVPGVKRFTYAANINLGGTSANWRFYFNGNMGGTGQAGRSNTITNILVSMMNPSVMALEATLNNTNGPNSSPTYTTIPTPFFCINKPANYNPGTVDINNDALTYSLVPGLDAISSGFVTYLTGYSATAPLAATGFSFSGTTGQLDFTPNLVQRSLVVTKVNEYRNSVLVGTSMREMTFVVLTNCNNNPPGGNISNVVGGTFVNNTSVNVCQNQGSFTFNINPTDIDGHNINVTSSGVPAGASFIVTNNNTIAPIGSFSWNLTGVTPGTYNFFVTFIDNGCPLSSKQTQAYTITVLPQPKITFALVSPATCSKKAVFNVTPSGSPAPWTLTVLQGITTVHTITGIVSTPQTDSLAPGTYTLRITSNNTCIKDTTITIANPSPIGATITYAKPPCNFYNTGVITIVANSGTTPYQYALGTGSFSATNTFTGLASGNYMLHVKDADNCLLDTLVNLPDSIKVHATVSAVTHILCNGAATGAFTITGNSATPPYLYKLGTGPLSATNTFTNLTAGNHNVHIEDSIQCFLDTVVTLTQPTPITSTSVVTQVVCYGEANGSITTTAAGGVSPYNYALNAGPYSSGNSFTGLVAGTYTVHIKDANNCLKDTVITITQPAMLTFSNIAVVGPTCNGATDASITLTGTGGTTPYTFAIGIGSFGSSNNFPGLAAGSYPVHIKDDNGCLKDSVANIADPPILFISAQVTKSTCATLANGKVVLGATGGEPPYQYSYGINPYTSSPTFTPLAAGTYLFHVRDNRNCTRDTLITIVDSLVVTATVSVVDVACNGDSTGVITVTGGGGIAPYTYAKGIFGTYTPTNVFGTLKALTYLIRIKDKNGCQKDTNVAVVEPPKLYAIVTPQDVRCNGFNDGKITVTGVGGTSPYTYALGTGPFSATNVFINLYIGTYVIHVKDNKGCTFDTTITLIQPPAMGITLALTDVKCFGDTTGTVTVNGSGGVLPYTYRADFNAYQTGNLLTGIGGGVHVIRVRDANGCFKDSTITITQPPKLVITNLSITHPTCPGFADGRVTITADGGTLPYQYSANSGSYTASPNIVSMLAGTYVLHVKDNNGCIRDTSVTLVGYPSIAWNEIITKDVSCFGFEDGTIAVTAGEGVPPLVITLGTKQPVDNIFSGLKADKYTVTVTDSKNCKIDTLLTIGSPDKLAVSVTPNKNDCEGYDDGGSIITKVDGGTLPYSYIWSSNPPKYSADLTGMPNGAYKVIVTDANDCTDSATATIIYDNCCKTFVPDAFTPNNDGKNDKLRILYKGNLSINLFNIYSRFGQLVFTTTDINDGWDGTLNGEPQDIGTYNYYIKGVCGNGGNKEVEYKGTATLIR